MQDTHICHDEHIICKWFKYIFLSCFAFCRRRCMFSLRISFWLVTNINYNFFSGRRIVLAWNALLSSPVDSVERFMLVNETDIYNFLPNNAILIKCWIPVGNAQILWASYTKQSYSVFGPSFLCRSIKLISNNFAADFCSLSFRLNSCRSSLFTEFHIKAISEI